MTRVILDAGLRAKLKDLSQPLELCDEARNVVAHIFPTGGLSDYEPWEPPISEEELRQRELSAEWYSSNEVLARLKDLEGR